MNLEDYRRLVRQVFCPLQTCLARPGERCVNDLQFPTDFVHDDRSFAYHQETALPLLNATQDDGFGPFYSDTPIGDHRASEAVQGALNVPRSETDQ